MTTTIAIAVLICGLIILAAMALQPQLPDCDREQREKLNEEKEGTK